MAESQYNNVFETLQGEEGTQGGSEVCTDAVSEYHQHSSGNLSHMEERLHSEQCVNNKHLKTQNRPLQNCVSDKDSAG